MPIFEYLCSACATVSEHLVLGGSDTVLCPKCGGREMNKLLSVTSSASGVKDGSRMPGAGDTACCGSQPRSQGCVPGSCCGKA